MSSLCVTHVSLDIIAAPTGVIPFIHTDYTRKVPGTAHRPFPTVSLISDTFYPHRLYSERSGRQVAAPTETYHVLHMISDFSPQLFDGLWNFSVDGAWIFESSENIWALLSLYPLSFAAQFLFPAVFLLKFLHIL